MRSDLMWSVFPFGTSTRWQDNLISFVPHLKTLGILIRQHAPEATVVLGGSAFTLFARRLMEEVPEVDVAVSGEAEAAFPLLLQNLRTPGAVPGALWRTDGAREPDPRRGA